MVSRRLLRPLSGHLIERFDYWLLPIGLTAQRFVGACPESNIREMKGRDSSEACEYFLYVLNVVRMWCAQFGRLRRLRLACHKPLSWAFSRAEDGESGRQDERKTEFEPATLTLAKKNASFVTCHFAQIGNTIADFVDRDWPLLPVIVNGLCVFRGARTTDFCTTYTTEAAPCPRRELYLNAPLGNFISGLESNRAERSSAL